MSPKPLTQNPALANVVYKNQWRDVFDGTVPDGWEPTLKVSVVTAAYNSATLPLTLASLAAQDYPEHLLEVIVIDDGSDPAVEIGEVAPRSTTLLRVPGDQGWGRSNALRLGIEASDGDIVYWVDSDMVLFADNVREHAKWAHFIPEAATIGHKGFVEAWDFTPEQVYAEVRSGEIRRHHDLSTLHRHWSLDIFDRTDELNTSGGRNYSTHMGACATVTRAVYDRTRGQDPDMKLGDDTEIAYQIWQAGAVFIPAHSAQTYHLGRATVQDKGNEVNYYNNIHFAQRMPVPRYRRRATNRQWSVPYLTAVVHVDAETAAMARTCVDLLLNQTETDLHVLLVGPWSTLHRDRRRVLADPDVELYLLQEWYRNEGRVSLVKEAPEDVFPSPYRLDVPVTVGLHSRALSRLMSIVFDEDLGVANFFPPPGADLSESVRVTSTAARNRAAAYVSDDVSFVEAIDAAWGVEWRSSHQVGLFDLRTADLEEAIKRADPQQVETLRDRLQKARARAAVAEKQVERLRREIERQESRTQEQLQELQDRTLASGLRRGVGKASRSVRRRIGS